MNKDIAKAIREGFPLPDYMPHVASAMRYDLMNGPCWALLIDNDIANFNADCYAPMRADLADDAMPSDVIVETYTSIVGDTLREYIDSLPSVLYIDEFGCISEKELEEIYATDEFGEGYFIATEYYEVSHRAIVCVLFGSVIASEFR